MSTVKNRTNDTGARNAWRANVSRTLKRNAATARCPKCGRKGALKRVGPWPTVTVCRWPGCGFER